MSIAARLLKTRWLMRAPIGLYRAGFGWLLGPRFLLLEHRGRVSGQSRFVVLEVVWRERRDALVVASAFGASSHWFRNLSANPSCRVSTGLRQRMPAVASVIPAAEGEMILEQYRRRYPRTWAKLLAAIRAATGDENPHIPLVRLQLDRDEPIRSFLGCGLPVASTAWTPPR